MNKIILLGNLTKDAELKFTQGTGNAVTKFTIAVSRGYGDKKETDFINCVCFSKMAENVANYTAKGSKVLVEGQLRINKYDDKEGNTRYSTEVFCNSIEFLTRVENGNTNTYNDEKVNTNTAKGDQDFDDLIENVCDVDMPF